MFLFTSVITFLLAFSNIRLISSTPVLPKAYDQIPADPHLNLTSALIKRVPPDSLCGDDQWMGRYCDGGAGPRAYRDNCRNGNGDIYRTGLEFCPTNTECMPTIDLNIQPNIACIPTPTSDQYTGPDRQDRIYRENPALAGTGWLIESITVAQDMNGATFSAHLDGMLKVLRTFVSDYIYLMYSFLQVLMDRLFLCHLMLFRPTCMGIMKNSAISIGGEGIVSRQGYLISKKMILSMSRQGFRYIRKRTSYMQCWGISEGVY